jgi:hypothetical protein
MIIDTRREVQYGIGEHFSQTILKEREMMASASALEYLQVRRDPKTRKREAQVYFNIP